MKISSYFKVLLVFIALLLFLAILTIPKIAVSQTTPTPIPTPENRQASNQLQQFLLDEDCLHPCWLAWTLGIDDLKDAQRVLKFSFGRPIQDITDLASESGYWFIGYNLSTTYPFLDADGVAVRFPDSKFVLSIQQYEDVDVVVAGGLTAQQPRWNYVDWSAYQLESILTHYGIPDEVTITYPLDGTDEAYYLNIRYFNLGVFVHYFMVFDKTSGLGVDNPDGIPICNHLSKMALLKVWYQSEPLPKLDLASEWDNVRFTQDYERPLDTVSDLTLAEFTELFSQPDTCFTTIPPNEWKPPFIG
ncbi:MAG: hypothetical protein BroJett018_46120 [Chloroflexota bacterium]|nr:MAG: hypothetical protein BroJett018_46120 [Chloroflexota bacterium]